MRIRLHSLMMFILLFSLFLNSFASAYDWYEKDFGGSVTVTSPPGSTFIWYEESFGGSVTVQGWSDWADWWNITWVNYSAPTSFTVSNYNNSVINTSWTSNAYADKTSIIRKKGSSPNSHGDGVECFNNTGDFYNDTGLDPGTHYYYRAWSFNDSHGLSSTNVSGDAWSSPGDPSNLQNTSISNNSINISWSKGDNTTNTVVRYNDTGYPANPQSGSEGYNSTGSYVNLSGLNESTSYYFRVWSYANSLFSDGYVSMLVTTYGNNSPPSGFTATSYNTTVINLSWTKGGDADTTHIRSKKGSYPTDVSDGSLVYNSSSNSYDDTGLDIGTLYFYRAWSYNVSSGFSLSNTSVNATTYPGSPSSLVNSSITYNSVNFSWTNGTNASYYVMRYSDWAYPSTPQSNASGFNLTGYNNGSVGGLSANTTYYFRLWSYLNPFGDINLSMLVTTNSTSVDVDPPYDGQSNYDTVNNALNLSWKRGNNSDEDVVVKKTGSYPSSPADGSIVDVNIANVTGGRYYYNESGVTSHAYYRVWSFNTTNNTYSSIGLSIPWGALVIWNVYNESNTSQSIIFDIEITNSDASQVYTDVNVTGPLYLDYNDIPYGDDTIFVITNSSYKQRTYYYDLAINSFHNYTFYLPPHTTVVDPGSGDDGGNTTDTILCLISVIDELEQPIPDANVTVKRYINTTDSYETISRLLTDGNGQISIWLVPNTLYLFDISKDGYVQTGSKYWTPTTLLYVKTFMLEFEDVEPEEPEIPSEEIVFNGYISGSVLYINYTDGINDTINTNILVYELNHSTNIESFYTSFSDTTNAAFQVNTSINTSNTYRVVLHYNHSYWGYQKQTILFNGNWTPPTTQDDSNNLFTLVYGFNPFGWTNTLMWFFMLVGLMYADERDTGKILVLLGGFFLFINYWVGFNTILSVFAGGIIPILFIIVGILVMWNDSQKKVVG